ncbi:hypothetical protein ACN47E_007702 [Coniothyrium glycines]
MLSTSLLSLSLLPLAFAHFNLDYPASRGFDDDKEGDFPCGGFNDVSSNRVDFPISGGPVQVRFGHPSTNVAVYMAIGDNPGSSFNIVAQQQIQVQGLGQFCFGNVAVPAGLNVTDGTKATIQVVTNNHESGGLYQCADVTLVNTPISSTDFNNNCKNGSTSITQQNISGNPNGTSTTAASGSSSASAAAASPTQTGAASQMKAVSWALGAVGLAGMAML